jgi:photosystem II stability/assembly factor-like uncharacterized protein
MKAFIKSIRLALIALMFGVTTLHAQWDTIKNYQPRFTGEMMNDIFFIGSTGYVVGHQPSLSSPFQRVGAISKTTDGGLTWNPTTQLFLVGTDTVFDLRSVYFTTPNIGYVAAICRTLRNNGPYSYSALLKTTDGGITWSSILSTINQSNAGSSILFNSVQFSSLYSGYIAASNQSTNDLNSHNGGSGLVYSTTNGGVNWTSATTFATSLANSVFFNNSGTGSAVAGITINAFGAFNYYYNSSYGMDYNPGEISRSTDWGNTWTQTYSDPSLGFCDIHFPSSQIGYAIGFSIGNPGEVVKTTDGGQTWNIIDILNAYPNFQPRCIHFINDTIGFMGGWAYSNSNAALLKTIDGGVTWMPENYPNMSSQGGRIVSLAFSTPVTGYALDDSANVALDYSSSIYGDFPTSSCSVFLGPDTTFCQTIGQLFATPGTPGNNYVFSWTPGIGLSDSTAQAPFVNHVSNQQYILTMTDTVTNCTATDTIVVSAYNPVWGPQYICSTIGDSTLMDLGPGATNYQWQFYQDTAGNTFSLGNLNQQTYWATQQGHYLAIAFTPSCGALTSYIQVLDTCGTYAWVSNVWPGDCNYDLTADMSDALQIGLSYNTTGPVRPSATSLWYAQPMTDWSQNFVQCNYKHADADGNGIINANDTLPIYQNYGNTHPYRLSPVVAPVTAPTLSLIANYDTCGLQTLVTVDVQLGTSTIPVDSLYGISFRITADAGLIDTTLTFINLNNTWLGTMGNNMFGFRKDFRTTGTIDAAESRDNLANRIGGFGTIAVFSIVTTDNLSGIAICHLKITDVTAVTIGQDYLTFNIVNDSVVIDPSVPAGINESGVQSPEFGVYPNPANDQFTIQTKSIATQIDICDLTGRIISTVIPNSTTTTVQTAEFANGIYLIRVRSGNSVTTQKLTITN